ncbi:quinone oxidoreductase [Vanrija albida]|uniref:Quinone oxidoreductase n=1 Tax=Vanrija albida TaxID=181172 RepID=A0ABR3Q349_9TREE
MALRTSQRIWILNKAPTGPVTSETFKLETRPLPALSAGKLLVQVQYISNDPAQRNFIAAGPKPLVAPGNPMRASAVAKVLESQSTKYKAGDSVFGYFGWTDYSVVDESAVTAPAAQLPGKPYASISPLGFTSLTAYAGTLDVLDVKPEHTVVVSGAAGAVGQVVVQLAKNVKGAKRVIGIAGDPDKVAYLKSIGADAAVDYKAADWKEQLAAIVGADGVDRFYDNVGGDIFDHLLTVLNPHGRVALCGQITSYNGEYTPFPHFADIISKSITIQGFTVFNYISRWGEATKDLRQFIEDGKLKVAESETVVPTKIEDVPATWLRLFEGKSRGKLITQLEE